MKCKDEMDIGKRAKIIFSEDAYELLLSISKDKWVSEVPQVLIDLIDDDYNIALKSVSIAPIVYFNLSDDLKRDGKIIQATLRAFKRFNKTNEINIKIEPLKKK